MENALLSEQIKLVATLGPDPTAADSYLTDYVDMSLYSRLLFVVSCENVVSTLTAQVYQAVREEAEESPAPDPGKVVSGKVVTFASSGDDDEQKMINLAGYELDKANGYQFARLSISSVDSPAGVAGLHVAVWGIPKNAIAAGHVATVTSVVS